VAALAMTCRALQRSEHKAVIRIGGLAALAAVVVTSLWLWSITAGFPFSTGGYQPDAILVGPGASPEIPPESDWSQVTAISGSAAHLDLTLSPDPWGNHYLIHPPAGPGAPHRADIARWVLSAGPNGILDTPFRQAPERAGLGGDDIGVRLE
jgi:hypothetical protein